MAKWSQFIGGSYESQALTADCERTVNWFPEVLQSQGATTPATLYPSPGVDRIDTELAYKVQPGRAHIFINGREFAILNRYLVEFSETGGTIRPDRYAATLGFPGMSQRQSPAMETGGINSSSRLMGTLGPMISARTP
jgi:hypothetical protein